MKRLTVLVFFSFLFAGIVSTDLAIGQVPPPPIILDVGPSGCAPSAEVCGDGIDQDCSGSDLACPTSDKDRDGFGVGLDCDDNNRAIYPEVSVACSASCGAGTKTCLGSGNFSPCSCTPLCEGTRCFYISANTGSDSNPGTFNAPWKTYLKIVSTDSKPPGWVQLQAGDVVYFMSGKYRENHSYSNKKRALFFRGVNGTPSAPITLKSYPGAQAVLWPNIRQTALELLQSSNFVIDGFEVMGAYGSGVYFAESNNIELKNTWIHDIDGVDNDNVAGLYFLSTVNVDAHHNLIHDNYDHVNADTGGQKTQNSRNIVLFGGGGHIRLHHNVIFQTPPITAAKTGGCINYKHTATVSGSVFEVDNNTFRNCALYSVGSGTFNTRIHHNLFMNSDAISFEDFGGDTQIRDNIVEFNTIVDGPGLNYEPTVQWGSTGNVTFRKNVIIDTGSYNNESGIVTISPYGTDSLYNATMSKLSFSNNCWYNRNTTPKWAVFAANGGAYGSLGSVMSFSTWQGLGLDGSSVVVDPGLDSSNIARASQCQSYGWSGN